MALTYCVDFPLRRARVCVQSIPSFWKQDDNHREGSLWPSDPEGQTSRKDVNINTMLRFQLSWLARIFLQSLPRDKTIPTSGLWIFVFTEHYFFLFQQFKCHMAKLSAKKSTLAGYFLKDWISSLWNFIILIFIRKIFKY